MGLARQWRFLRGLCAERGVAAAAMCVYLLFPSLLGRHVTLVCCLSLGVCLQPPSLQAPHAGRRHAGTASAPRKLPGAGMLS